MRGQAASEANTVRVATGGAIALIFVTLSVLVAGASREIERRRRQAQATLVGTLTILADVIDKRDPYTAGHWRRVAIYSRLLARELHLAFVECDTIEHAALMHDLGKIGIPDAVLLKPAALDEDERRPWERIPRSARRSFARAARWKRSCPASSIITSVSTARGIPQSFAGKPSRAARG